MRLADLLLEEAETLEAARRGTRLRAVLVDAADLIERLEVSLAQWKACALEGERRVQRLLDRIDELEADQEALL